jgi:hypothetical protein
MLDVKTLKLGKDPAKHDPKNLKLSDYLPGILPPRSLLYNVDRDGLGLPTALELFMAGNDKKGCCVVSGEAHQTARFEYAEQKKLIWKDDKAMTASVLPRYYKLGGATICNPHPDNGLYVANSNEAWRKGWRVSGKKLGIHAYAEINTKRLDQLEAAIYYLLGAGLGVALPYSAQAQTGLGGVWDVAGGAAGVRNSWGGHYIYVLEYDHANAIATCISWGIPQKMTYDFIEYYADESCGFVDSRDPFLKVSPIDQEKLEADLNAICAG